MLTPHLIDAKPPLPFEWTLGHSLALAVGVFVLIVVIVQGFTAPAAGLKVGVHYHYPARKVKVHVAAARAKATPLVVHQREYGERWPFTAPAATLYCDRVTRIVSVELAGVRYTLTGSPGSAASPAVWRDDPARPGQKMDLSDLIARAKRLCA